MNSSSQPYPCPPSRLRMSSPSTSIEEPLRRSSAMKTKNRIQTVGRSEEHTSELQSLAYLVCRLLLASTTTTTHPRSLHDALPISQGLRDLGPRWGDTRRGGL